MTLISTLQDNLQEQLSNNLNTIFSNIFEQISIPTSEGLRSFFSGGLGGLFGGGGNGGGGGILSSIASFLTFQEGGIVPNAPGSGDRVPALLTPGELVVPQQNFEDLNRNQGNRTVNINISGNVDQRAIEQIRTIVSGSPEQVGAAMMQFDQATSGLRRGL